jgi:ABC-type antimicrobial peptide transport system permease subunit
VFNGHAIGRHFSEGRPPRKVEFEVVGVVADSKYTTLKAPVTPGFYDYHSRRAGGMYGGMTFVVRTSRAPAQYEREFRNAVSGANTNVALTKFRTQREQINQTIGRERAFAFLLTLFGAFALLLASIGLHGVTSYSVARRTNEIGIRLALGAQRGEVLWMILRQVLVLGAAGLAVGIPAAIAARPAIGSMLFGLSPIDISTLTGAASAMLAVTMLAGFLPARRAASLDPLKAIRRD